MKRAILIVGAPRSGTSVTAHVINRLGVYFGNPKKFVDAEQNKHNPIFFELNELNTINNEIFLRFNKKWADFDWLPLVSDFPEAVIYSFTNRIKQFIETEFGNSEQIGLKDPRFCFTLPIWTKILEHLGYKVDFVFTTRNLNAIFSSNKAVNKASSEKNFRITLESILASSYFLKNKPVVRVFYELLIIQPKTEVNNLCNRLDLDTSQIDNACYVIAPNLNHELQFSNKLFFKYFERVSSASSDLAIEYEEFRETALALTYERDLLINSLNIQLAEYKEHIAHKVEELKHKNQELIQIYSSNTWRWSRKIADFIEKVLPKYSLKRKLIIKLNTYFKII